MLSTGELALLLAPADNPQANTQQSVVQVYARNLQPLTVRN